MDYLGVSIVIYIFLVILIALLFLKLRKFKYLNNQDQSYYNFESYNVFNYFDEDIAIFNRDGSLCYVNHPENNLFLKSNLTLLKDSNDTLKVELIDNLKERFKNHHILNVENVINGKSNNYQFQQQLRTQGEFVTIKVFYTNHNNYLLFISKNISKLHSLQHTVCNNEKRYHALMDLVPIALFMEDDKGIFYANQSALKMVSSKNITNILGKPFINFLNSSSQEDFLNKLSNKEDPNLLSIFDMYFRSTTGEEKVVDIQRYNISTEGKDLTLLLVKDACQRIRSYEIEKNYEASNDLLEKIIESDKVKTEFFANISHELRTPINIIFSAMQMLNLKCNLNNSTDSSLKNYNKMIKQNCYRLLRLVNNLIDITKIDAGFYNISLKNHEVIKIIEDITLSVANYIEDKHIELVFDTELEEKVICCDPDKIERIMLNLLANAVKFTPEGGSIFVNIYNNDPYLTISVKDTGIGIPEEKKDLIFERFRQIEKTSHLNITGSGIGLSLVKSLVEMHKGNLHVESTPGEGSEFIINLPCSLCEDCDEESMYENSWKQNVEKINIEFSDIYS
ncbi:HAMP domain-containing histidine kinase [Clostridium sp. MSJ-4]|uniref:HAMP domain-containing histidine kinase n=1 Tax=Clostridium simiarum TaxID=2841506 RepID=A0ABS6F1T5_9CLOT|nr:HAMP domain-containing sensor histidine kinase [Clostridium simiarum]MBU5592203.1 HAMP domain-containing histidine kinase [Clostridium simiarum]